MKALVLSIALATSTIVASALAQKAPAPAPSTVTLALNEDEQKVLSTSIKDGIIYSLQLQIGQLQQEKQDLQHKLDAQPIEQQYTTWRTAFDAQVAAIKAAHHWGPDVTFNYEKLAFVRNSSVQPKATSTPPAK